MRYFLNYRRKLYEIVCSSEISFYFKLNSISPLYDPFDLLADLEGADLDALRHVIGTAVDDDDARLDVDPRDGRCDLRRIGGGPDADRRQRRRRNHQFAHW